MKKLICVEDDEDIRKLIEYALSSREFSVTGCENAADFYKALEQETPDVVLLDIMLPDESGTDILKKLRADKRFHNLPVIFLTAKSSRIDKIKGLDEGADDYITKPFDIIELISRINALIRRTSRTMPDTIDFHGICIIPENHEAICGNEKIPLTYKEFELLLLLVTNLGRALSRETLMNSVWGFDFAGETRTIDVHIRTLRKKLGEGGQYIETVRNLGYKAV